MHTRTCSCLSQLQTRGAPSSCWGGMTFQAGFACGGVACHRHRCRRWMTFPPCFRPNGPTQSSPGQSDGGGHAGIAPPWESGEITPKPRTGRYKMRPEFVLT